jgi:predicted permease
VRQLLVESLILSLAGAGAGLAVAFAGMGTVRTLMPDAMSLVAPPTVDLRVLGFAAGLALVTGLAFGLWPAFGAARADPNETIKSGGLGMTTAGAGRLRRVLVVVELAVALTLVTGSLLMLRSFKALLDTDPGFRPEQVASVELAFERGHSADRRLATLADALGRLDGSPGIEAAGVVNDLPLRGSGGIAVSVDAEGVSHDASRNSFARFLQASGGYFKAMGIPLIRGRVMAPTDDSAAPKVVVVNETMARTIWPGQDPVGKRIKDFGPPDGGPQGYRTVIGVVADVREHTIDSDPGLQMYLSVYELTPNNAAIVVRGTLPRPALLSRLREAVHASRPDQALFNLRTMDEVMSTARAPRRTNTTLITAFGVLALLLAAIGVFGVVSYGVTRRTRELGIRAALGATAGSLVRLVATEGLLLALAGIVVGMGGAWAFSRALASLLYGVAPQDVATFIAAPLVLFGFVVVATMIPARRAAALNPVDVIRQD